MIRKILFISMWVILAGGLIFTLGFAGKQEGKQTCKAPLIKIHAEDDNYFVEPGDIMELIRSKGDSITGQPIASVNVFKIENLLYANPWIRKADVFMDIDGALEINVDVRIPMVRIINSTGESYFIDSDGKLMLWSPQYTPRVLVATGNISESYGAWYKKSMNEIMNDDSLARRTVLDDIYAMAKFISEDEFWNAQVGQIKCERNGEIELIPQVGDHTIIFGDTMDMKEKFTKLKLFYAEGLNHTSWNMYDTINLKFSSQVVCTKIK